MTNEIEKTKPEMVAKPVSIVLTAVMKDETKNLEKFFKGLIPIIDYYIIVDTGSTDGTPEAIKTMMDEHNIQGEIHFEDFDYLGKHRQEAIRLAWGKGDYFITSLDADEEFQVAEGFNKSLLTFDLYYVTKIHGNVAYKIPCIVKMKDKPYRWDDNSGDKVVERYTAQWVERVHSYFRVDTQNTAYTEDVWIISTPQGGSRSSGKTQEQKFMRDAKLLEKEMKLRPSPRNQFYLAQSYRDAGKNDAARKNYKKRVAMGGFPEEVYISMLWEARCGGMADNKFDWEGTIKTHKFRPHRLEALMDMVRYCRVSQYHWMGYVIGKEALSMASPSEDVLFVENQIVWRMEDEFSLCAFQVGKFDESIKACERALVHDIPQNDKARIKNNIVEIRKIRNKVRGVKDVDDKKV